MEGKYDISEVFLKNFVRELIRNKAKQSRKVFDNRVKKIKENITIYKSPNEFTDNLINKQIQKEIRDSKEEVVEIENADSLLSSIAQKDMTSKDTYNLPIPTAPPITIKPDKPKNQIPIQKPLAQFRPQVTRPTRQMIPNRMKRIVPPLMQMKQNLTPAKRMNEIEEFVPSITEQKTDIGLPKIDNILKDPKVLTVECPGPNKPVLIYKNGSIQTSNILLTGEEINNLMKNFSEKTRIPIMSGVFKAAIGNLIVTAVMSDFVGTRFIIQKKPSIN